MESDGDGECEGGIWRVEGGEIEGWESKRMEGCRTWSTTAGRIRGC